MSLYNSYRPMGYGEVIGQEGIISSLKNMVAENKVSSTMLFYGPRGTGKTTCARILAKALNCDNPKEPGVPCGECESCRDIANGDSLNVMEIDAASNTGIDNMRELKASSNLVGVGGKWKVYIIDECHMLSKAAQNSALKMLEESPEKTLFILATTELHKVEGTIVSRSLMFDFRPVTIDMISKRLSYICDAEKFEYEEAALALIAKIAHGGVRDSISVLERVALENNKKVLVKGIVRSLGITPTEVLMRLSGVIKGDYKDAIEIADTVIREGYDIYQFLNSAMDYYRSVLMLKIGMNHLVKVEVQMLNNMDEVSGIVSKEQISKAISILEDAIEKYKYTEDKQILLELALYKIADGFSVKTVEVDHLNEVKMPAQIDMSQIEAMMSKRINEIMASIKPVNTVNTNVVPNNAVVQAPQNQEVRCDTVNNVPNNTALNVQNVSVGQQMLDYLKANWGQFLKILQGNNCSIATIIEMSRPISFENNILVVEFPSNAAFYCDMFNSQMVPETSTILSKCMNVRCSVAAQVVIESSCDTVNNTYIETASEIPKEPIMPQFLANDFTNSSQPEVKEVENQFNVQNTGGTEFHIEPQVQQQSTQLPNETQSFFGQPVVQGVQEVREVVEVEEKKVSKEDQVDMNMLDNMFV